MTIAHPVRSSSWRTMRQILRPIYRAPAHALLFCYGVFGSLVLALWWRIQPLFYKVGVPAGTLGHWSAVLVLRFATEEEKREIMRKVLRRHHGRDQIDVDGQRLARSDLPLPLQSDPVDDLPLPSFISKGPAAHDD